MCGGHFVESLKFITHIFEALKSKKNLSEMALFWDIFIGNIYRGYVIDPSFLEATVKRFLVRNARHDNAFYTSSHIRDALLSPVL